METLVLGAAPFHPTSPRTGLSGKTILRMSNLILAGAEQDIYLECYRGSFDLNETIPTLNLTGTITAAIDDLTLVGTGTLFTTELRSGQMFFCVDDMFMVNRVVDDTHITVYRGPAATLTAATGERMPVLFEIDRRRGTLIQGNALELDKGSILATGFGTLRIDGDELDAVAPVNEPKGVGTGADDASVGTQAWTTPANITGSGGGVAHCAPVGAAITTHYLKGTNCGFAAIPGGATITGIAVAIRKRVTGAITETVSDSKVRIVKPSGAIGTTERASTVPWPNTTFAYTVYGGQNDLWGETWAPADFADADVGCVISAVTNDPGGESATLEVDYMFIIVYYTTAAGSSMVLSGSPKIAIYDDVTQTYAIYPLNFPTPTVAPTLTDEAGGTHGMVAGDYSIRLEFSSTITKGYGNPGPRANVSLVSDGDQIGVDVTAMAADIAAAIAAGADGLDVYATETTSNPNQGPWSYVRTVPFSEIDPATHIFLIDYLDAEISRLGLLDFDNNSPPSAGFVATLEGNPQWVSCYGKNNLSPGPSLVPAKAQNIEAAPAGWNVTSSPPEYLLGVIASLARLYCPTPKTLQQGVWNPTGDPLIPPTSLRPYWHMGFSNPYQVIFALGLLVGYPHGGPTKSIADAEEANAQFFGGYVAEIIQNWIGPHVLVEWDPDPMVNAICFFHPADSQNEDGFWQTRVIVWSLNIQDYIGEVMITDSTRDMVVSGVARIDNQLTFVAGGRMGADIVFDTFEWNVVSGESIPWYAAWQLQAGGVLDRNKSVKASRANGKFTNGEIQIYGFDSEVVEDLTDIENGTNSLSGSIPIDSTGVITTARGRMNFPNCFVFTQRVAGVWDGNGDPDRLNGSTMEFLITGNRR